MDEATVKGLREMANTISPPGKYAVVDKNQRLIMGWLTQARAEEYTRYYAGAKVMEMANYWE